MTLTPKRTVCKRPIADIALQLRWPGKSQEANAPKMIAKEVSLTLDGEAQSYECASVSFLPAFLSIHRVKPHPLQAMPGQASIQDPGQHFTLIFPEQLAYSALERKRSEYGLSGPDIGEMAMYRGAAGRDGTGSHGIDDFRLSFLVEPENDRLEFQVGGSLVEKEQLFPGALEPKRRFKFELSLSFPFSQLPELFRQCPNAADDIARALSRRLGHFA